jgi:hypothetical protein
MPRVQAVFSFAALDILSNRAVLGPAAHQQGATCKRRRPMKNSILTVAVSLAMLGGAAAATITNKDAESHVLIVTEGSDKVEMVIEPNATATFCPVGCFVTMPSGDRETLSGEETIEIINRSAVIQ